MYFIILFFLAKIARTCHINEIVSPVTQSDIYCLYRDGVNERAMRAHTHEYCL